MRVFGLIEAVELGGTPLQYSEAALMARFERLFLRIRLSYRFDIPLPDLGTCQILSEINQNGEEVAGKDSEAESVLQAFARIALSTRMPMFGLFTSVARLERLAQEANEAEMVGTIRAGQVFGITFDDLEEGKSTDARFVRLLDSDA